MIRNSAQAKGLSGHFNQSRTISMNSSDALALVEHGSEIYLDVRPPVGSCFSAASLFIGTHSSNFILAEMPNVSGNNLNVYLQEGFWVNVQALSYRGEGAKINFRSQIMHIIYKPLPLLFLSMPSTMFVSQLRNEMRHDVNLPAKAYVNKEQSECVIRDLSRNGCRFFTAPMGRVFSMGEDVSFKIKLNDKLVILKPTFRSTFKNKYRCSDHQAPG